MDIQEHGAANGWLDQWEVFRARSAAGFPPNHFMAQGSAVTRKEPERGKVEVGGARFVARSLDVLVFLARRCDTAGRPKILVAPINANGDWQPELTR